MAIKISVEKVVTGDGEKSSKILDIKCLSYEKLPVLYLDGKEPVVFRSTDKKGIVLRHGKDLPYEFHVGIVYPEDMFIEILAHISKAGEHLKKVNEKLSRLRKEWNGKVVYEI